MGQKVNPHGLRVGVIKDWDSRWYARNEKVGDLLVEDKKIRDYLKKTLYSAGIPKIEIERDNAKVRIYLHCARPGVVIGKGGEGKSRIGLVLKRLMGDAASNGSVQKVENNRFARADLERRLLMIDDDMDMNALPKTNYIKTIVTAEAKLDLERKGVQSYQRDIYARFLCFGNGALTSLYDHSDGFFRRQLILTTKDKPADRTDDPFLVEKMCAELEGILLWCLEGLHRLVQNDFRFTVSERAAANVDTIKRSSNNVIDFMESEGYFRFKADYSISSKEFYDIYKQWCEDNACHSVSAIRFSAELRQNDRRYNLEATNNIYLPGGRRVRGFVGIEPLVHPCP